MCILYLDLILIRIEYAKIVEHNKISWIQKFLNDKQCETQAQ